MSTTIQGRKVGNIVMTHGIWTHTKGAVEETVKVAGRVFGAIFSHLDTGVAHDVLNSWSVSQDTVNGVSTITIHNQSDVTEGRMLIFHTG